MISCERIANVLGVSPDTYTPKEEKEFHLASPEQPNTKSATNLASTMVRQSLADLRKRLE